MKQLLWNALTAGVRLMPERLRLAFLEQPLIVPLDFADLKIVAHGPVEYYIRAKSAAKEPDMVMWLNEMPHDAVFVDIGANVGTYSLIAAKMRPDAFILAIEPAAMNYASLCRNIHLNRMGDRIQPICAMLASYSGMGLFEYSSWEPGSALHQNHPEKTALPQQMLAYRLDDLIDLLNFPKPTRIKIDVDGAELEVLKGAIHMISYAESIMIEVGDTVADIETLRLIKDRGYREHSRRQCQPNGEYSKYWNVRLDKQ